MDETRYGRNSFTPEDDRKNLENRVGAVGVARCTITQHNLTVESEQDYWKITDGVICL